MARSGTRGKRGAKPPYTSAADIDTFFERVRNISPPDKVASKWVTDMKLSAAQPAGVVAVLKWLAIVDEDGLPDAQRWNKVRVPATRAESLAPLVQTAYEAVFVRVNVGEASRADLEGAMIDAYNVGSTARYIGCFQSLCGHAGLGAPTGAAENGSSEATPKAFRATSTPKRSTAEGKNASSATGNTGTADTPTNKTPADREASVSILLNIEIPAEWAEQQIRDRLAIVTKAVRGG